MSLVRFRLWAPFAGLAHLVERHLAKVEVASSSLVARSKKGNTTHWVVFPFLERASLLRKLILRGGLKSRGNRRCAASGGRSEPVSRKRRCLWFSKGHKQQCRDGVHPTKVPLANIPFLAGSRRLYILFRTHKAIEIGRPIGCPVSFGSGLSFCSVADCLWRKRKVAALK